MFFVNAALNDISIGTAGLVALLGYAVVFVGLIALMAVIMIVGKIMVAKKSKAAAPAPAAADYSLSGKHVLVAEDNDLNLEIARCMLQDAGVKTAEARNGREAVEKFAASEEGAFDAILMDVMMPVMDGMQAARAIRALPRRDAADVPIIAMTANAFAEDQSRARDCGMTKYLTKPVDPAKLHAALSICRRQG